MPNRLHELQDLSTGLYNDAFFHASLATRVAAARRALRPLSIVLLTVGGRPGDVDLRTTTERQVADGLRRALRESDLACRLDGDRFGLLLDSTPGTGAVLTVDRFRSLLEDRDPRCLLWAGVATYPSHALDADGLFGAAGDALRDARAWEHSRIEVAIPA